LEGGLIAAWKRNPVGDHKIRYFSLN
jgi:hypothetical protein